VCFRDSRRALLVFVGTCLLGSLIARSPAAGQERAPENLLANPSFELGSQAWHVATGGKTEARFQVQGDDAPDGRHAGRVTIGRVEEWGAQFGQTLDAGAVGRTYTFAALARSAGKPVGASLQIERGARPWDRAAKSPRFALTRDEWTELHVTFTVDKPFPQGWFAYLTCTEPNVELLVDMFRLTEGEYVPYETWRDAQIMRMPHVRLFDTGRRSPLSPSQDGFWKEDQWTALPEDETNHAFQGDAVIENDRLAVVFRRGESGARVYSRSAAPDAALRALLAPSAGEWGESAESDESDESAAWGARLRAVRIVENTPARVALDAAFGRDGTPGPVVRFALEIGQPFVKTRAGEGTRGLRLRAPGRFVVLPDFFADDLVVDATTLPVDRAELPSEHFLLSMVPGGRAIVMSVSDSAAEDVRVTLSGEGAERMIDGAEIRYGDDGTIWVAVIEGADAWSVREIAPDDAGKVLPLDWRTPYPAQWRVDWTQSSGLTDSWEMIAERPDGRFEKHDLFGQPHTIDADRRRWTTVLGWFPYPCWVDREGRGFLQPLAKRLRFEGPALIYPVNRAARTPLDAFTVVDVVRATLGVGPCEYILDVEGQPTAMKGRATCATRDTLNPIYAAGRQRQERATIEKALDEVLVFVKHIRSRIDAYVEFGHELRAYLDQQKRAHPELAEFLAEMDGLARAIDERFDARKDKIRTPAYVAGLTEKFRRTLLDDEGPDALDRCKEITGAIVTVGGNQDELVGECRMAVKILRQQAGLAMARDPRTAEIAGEIRRRTQEVLRNPASYEAPRH